MTKKTHVTILEVMKRASSTVDNKFITEQLLGDSYVSVMKSINAKGIDESTSVNNFIRSCSSNNKNANRYLKECVSILNETIDKPYNSKIADSINSEIIPKCKDLDMVESCLQDVKNPEDKSMFLETVESLRHCDRVLENYNRISSRFNMDSYKSSLAFAGGFGSPNKELFKEAGYDIASLLDTYDMPLRKKFAVAVETSLYLNHMQGGANNNPDVIEGITEYYMLNNPVITDKDYDSIINTLESNVFLEAYDVSKVSYMFNNNNISFRDRLLAEAGKNTSITMEYRNIIEKIATCKSVSVAKGLIKAAFTLIISTFVIAGTVSFTTVLSLLCAIYSLILTIALSPAVVVNCINQELKNAEQTMKAYSNGENKEVVKRYNKVYKFTRDISDSISNGDALVEAADLFEKIIPDSGVDAPVLKKQIDDDFAFMSVNDICSTVMESNKFADSEDVKDLLDKYKAEQKKSVPGFKRVLNKIFTRKPEHIIDDVPNILSAIRTFFILSTGIIPVIGPAIALVGFCVDKFVEFSLKREEAEKVVNYFKSEKAECEKKYDKMKDGDKKDDLGEYIECLDKAIDKLEEYRDKLYTDEELEKMDELEESTINFYNKIDIDTFIDSYMPSLAASVSRAVQIIRNEVIRKCSNICVYDEYEAAGVPISSAVTKITPQEMLSFYTTPEGIMDIPLGKLIECTSDPVKNTGESIYAMAIDICSEANKYIDKNYTLTCYHVGGKVIISINCFKCIAVDYIEDHVDNSITETASQLMGEVLVAEQFINETCELEPDTILSDLTTCIDVIKDEDILDLCHIINTAHLYTDEFIDYLKDYRNSSLIPGSQEDIATAKAVDTMIDNVSTDNADDYSQLSQLDYLATLEATELLRAITEEAKKVKESGKKKKDGPGIIDKAKEAIKKKQKENASKEKVPITTTAKLAAKSVENKAKDVSTKEKEVSRTIDAYAGSLNRSIKEALTSKRRESIIKGSIIPSFSQLIKAAIGIGAVAKIFSPAAAAITAVGALAVSKHLTKKERGILLEEIDVELQVVEKQIEKCEDDPKRYKQLLMYQRKLQRESQRIRYAISVRGKDVPDPTE